MNGHSKKVQKSNTEMAESLPHTEVTAGSPPTSSTLKPNRIMPLQTPAKITRSNLESLSYQNISRWSASKDNPFDATNHQFQIKAILLFSRFKRTQRAIYLYNAFAEYVNQLRKNSTVLNQSDRSNDHIFLLNTIIITVPWLSKPPLAPATTVDTKSTSSASPEQSGLFCTSWSSRFIERIWKRTLWMLKVQQFNEKCWCKEYAANFNLKFKKVSSRWLPKNWKKLLIKGNPNIHPLQKNFPLHFLLWLNVLMPEK